jgi:two-component system cell cycle response regulator
LLQEAPRLVRRPVLRILVVNESCEEAEDVRALLEGQGEFVTHTACSIDEAEMLLDEDCFDVAVIDDCLWTARNNRLVRHLRERHRDVAVVLLINAEDERETLPALKLGAHDFISKQHLHDGAQLQARILGAFEESRTLRRRDTMVRWLEREAKTDHLTGFHNRHSFDQHLRDVCDRCRLVAAPVTLIVVDVAGTRAVNTTHGHEAGDAMIRRAAVGISRCIRGNDFAARIGGDDFGIVLPDADLALGRRIARRIAHEIERLNAAEWADQIPVAVTFGVATGVSCEPQALFMAAERQLSHHKGSRLVGPFFGRREDSTGPFVA